MPLRAEIDSGQLTATDVGSPPLMRTLMLCAASHIPASAAAQAVEKLVVELVRTLCATGQWPGASVLRAADS
jgi:LysR family nitrogen assimilation transcriptional regulator